MNIEINVDVLGYTSKLFTSNITTGTIVSHPTFNVIASNYGPIYGTISTFVEILGQTVNTISNASIESSVIVNGYGGIRIPIVTYSTVTNLDSSTSSVVATEVFEPGGYTTTYTQFTTVDDNGNVEVSGSVGPYANYSPITGGPVTVNFNANSQNAFSEPYVVNDSTSNIRQLKLALGAIPMNLTKI